MKPANATTAPISSSFGPLPEADLTAITSAPTSATIAAAFSEDLAIRG